MLRQLIFRDFEEKGQEIDFDEVDEECVSGVEHEFEGEDGVGAECDVDYLFVEYVVGLLE